MRWGYRMSQCHRARRRVSLVQMARCVEATDEANER